MRYFWLIASLILLPTIALAEEASKKAANPILLLFEHHDYNGEDRDRGGLEIPLNTSWRNLGEVTDKNGKVVMFNDMLTSFHLANGYRAEFFEHIEFKGKHFSVPKDFPNDTTQLPGGRHWPNDEVSSIKLFDTNGVEIPPPALPAK